MKLPRHHQPLPMSQSQSRVTPENIPPSRKRTSKFPSAFCSGPCHKPKPYMVTLRTSVVTYSCSHCELTNLVAFGCFSKNRYSEITMSQSHDWCQQDHTPLVTIFRCEVERRNEYEASESCGHDDFPRCHSEQFDNRNVSCDKVAYAEHCNQNKGAPGWHDITENNKKKRWKVFNSIRKIQQNLYPNTMLHLPWAEAVGSCVLGQESRDKSNA